MSLLAVSVFLSESILTSIDGHFELFFGFLKNNYTYLETSSDIIPLLIADDFLGILLPKSFDS
jgi:hypothetical protein